ncbi:MAG: bifunctional DNA-formamidopyrimidine glycosylase/DNA-(apurinic or apyrimidinic site) lyase [Verrucomicrobia bacterium]|jgi:formamidopyrimidine-DNA glycosylase|nr:bifunctional DNA-formamidopyrimidine glycosylase/DNA-(apurinic or apyrimidinic site) lyase [Verrucomicrobiota bacterium]
MPELPEVEVLVRHLASRLPGRTIQQVRVLATASLHGPTPRQFQTVLTRARFESVRRRGKYLLLTFRKDRRSRQLIAHLGMSGRLYLDRAAHPLPRHARIVMGLGRQNLVFEDMRRFGGMTLDASALAQLGPEPLDPGFTTETLRGALAASRQPIKVRLLDQSVIAGIGNIYASEALFLARIDPRTPSRDLTPQVLHRLRTAIRRVLSEAIRFGSTIPLHFGSPERTDDLFYYGQSPQSPGRYQERLRVYDREGQPCRRCQQSIQRLVQAGRSTYYCPACQNDA